MSQPPLNSSEKKMLAIRRSPRKEKKISCMALQRAVHTRKVRGRGGEAKKTAARKKKVR